MQTAIMRGVPAHALSHQNATEVCAFDPADWLARYTALGGVYVANGKLNLCIIVNSQTEEQLSQVREMVVALTDDDKAAILAHINAEKVKRAPTWEELLAEHESADAAQRAHPYGSTSPLDPAYAELDRQNNELCAKLRASYLALINAPAPDYTALRRKFEIVAEVYEMDEEVGPILRDFDRLGEVRPILNDPIERYWAAFHACNRGELDEAGYMAADEALWAFTPTTPHDFIRKIEAAWAVGGNPSDERHAAMVRDAIALLGPDSRSGEA